MKIYVVTILDGPGWHSRGQLFYQTEEEAERSEAEYNQIPNTYAEWDEYEFDVSPEGMIEALRRLGSHPNNGLSRKDASAHKDEQGCLIWDRDRPPNPKKLQKQERKIKPLSYPLSF